MQVHQVLNEVIRIEVMWLRHRARWLMIAFGLVRMVCLAAAPRQSLITGGGLDSQCRTVNAVQYG